MKKGSMERWGRINGGGSVRKKLDSVSSLFLMTKGINKEQYNSSNNNNKDTTHRFRESFILSPQWLFSESCFRNAGKRKYCMEPSCRHISETLSRLTELLCALITSPGIFRHVNIT